MVARKPITHLHPHLHLSYLSQPQTLQLSLHRPAYAHLISIYLTLTLITFAHILPLLITSILTLHQPQYTATSTARRSSSSRAFEKRGT